MRLLPKSFSVSLPIGPEVSLDMSEEAERAAWALYVELNTRIAIEDFEPRQGSVREALNSIYSLFGITREVLKAAGIDACRARKGHESLGWLAMNMLNQVIRPRLVGWHTSLSAFEGATWKSWIEAGKALPNSPSLAGSLVDESKWEGYDTFHEELADLQGCLRVYVEIYGALAGVMESERVTTLETE